METVLITSDHRGFALKEALKVRLANDFNVIDVGPTSYQVDDDYPDFVKNLGKLIVSNNVRGVAICGTGIGINIALNKIKGIYCGLCLSPKTAESAVIDDFCNVISLPSNEIEIDLATEIVNKFLTTHNPILERHKIRHDKVILLENDF